MGMLQEGRWLDRWYETKNTGGRFSRTPQTFRNWITPDGSPGPSGIGGFKAEAHRYHLYVSYACPWAHRTLLFRALKGLDRMISLSVVHWHMATNGWAFYEGDGVIPDNVNGSTYLYQVYTKASPTYSGRVTVPVLWDKHSQTIVSNESSEIIRMFNRAFDDVGARPGDYYPSSLRTEIDALNTRIYETVNNGVYKCGFATTQAAYEEAMIPLFDTLEWLEDLLRERRYLAGSTITEADWRLFTTLIRFDAVYVGHFKCNRKRIRDLPNLSGYLRDLYQHPGVAATLNMDHIKRHYYCSHTSINPTQIVPVGPEDDFSASHTRDRIGQRNN